MMTTAIRSGLFFTLTAGLLIAAACSTSSESAAPADQTPTGVCGTSLTMGDEAQDACVNASCCGSLTDCQADETCSACLSVGGTDCDTNALLAAFWQCFGESDCDGSGSAGAGGSGGEAGHAGAAGSTGGAAGSSGAAGAAGTAGAAGASGAAGATGVPGACKQTCINKAINHEGECDECMAKVCKKEYDACMADKGSGSCLTCGEAGNGYMCDGSDVLESALIKCACKATACY